MKQTKVWFNSTDGLKLCGILTEPREKAKGVVVLAHGITVEKNEGGFYKELASLLAKKGLSSLRFDFRGHGESEGHSYAMTIKGEIADLGSAVNFLKQRTKFKKVVIIGTSFGGGIAVFYAAKQPRNISSLVLLCPVLDYKRTFLKPETEWAQEWFSAEVFTKALKTGKLDLDGFKLGRELLAEFTKRSPGETLLKLKLPALIIHGTEDSYVPFDASKKYGLKYKHGRFLPIKGADHGFEDFEDRVFEKVTKWILTNLAD